MLFKLIFNVLKKTIVTLSNFGEQIKKLFLVNTFIMLSSVSPAQGMLSIGVVGGAAIALEDFGYKYGTCFGGNRIKF